MNDFREGKGRMDYHSGGFYDGDWKNDLKEGHGIFDWGCEYYNGQWSDN
jgi:hypothetical protein